MNTYFILYGEKDNTKYYINNLDPLVWTASPLEAKKYSNRYNAEYDILKKYDNYKIMKDNIKNGYLEKLYISEIVFDVIPNKVIECWRLKIL